MDSMPSGVVFACAKALPVAPTQTSVERQIISGAAMRFMMSPALRNKSCGRQGLVSCSIRALAPENRLCVVLRHIWGVIRCIDAIDGRL